MAKDLKTLKKKRVFFVSLNRSDKEGEEYLPGQYLAIGESPDCEINPIPGFPERHRLLERTKKGYNLIIPSNLEGAINRGNLSLPINGLIEFGLLKKKGNSFIFPIADNEGYILTVKDCTITFGYKDITLPEKIKKEKIDRALKKPLINRDDYSFFTILIIALIINFSMVNYLNSLEIKKKEDPLEAIKKMPQRFAKLILQPPKPKATKTKVEEPVKEKEKKEENVKKEIEAPREEKKSPEEVEKRAEPLEVAMIPPSQTNSAREQIREKVKTKGLLGVIMAKAVSDEISSDVSGLMKNIGKGGVDEKREDVLAALDLKRGSDEGLSKKDADISPKIKMRDTSEIIGEKKDILKEELNKREDVQSIIKKRDEAEVYRTVGSYVGGLKYLYNSALRKNPSLKGKITVKIIISPEGKVIKSEVVSSTLNFSELEEAIINRIYKWRFTEQLDVGDFAIDYTFDFAPLG